MRKSPARIGSVRVSKTEGKAPIFAACRANERLIGGGCRGTDSYASINRSYPSDHGENDTMGARWNCDALSTYVERPLEAFALCMTVQPEGE